MNNTKVSVIIPVYNTEAYVAQTVRSITGQTLRELEIILIDDGSTDGGAEIMQRLAAEDARIVLLSQSNQGLSQTRNRGIDCAMGRYIYFMDSDDLLEDDALELCYNRAEQDALDLVFFDAECFGAKSNKGVWFDYRRVEALGEEPARGSELLRRMLDHKCYRAAVWMSFIRTDYLRRLGLRFHKGIIHEDELFTPQLYIGASRAAGIHRAFFRRRVREGSIMTTSFSERNLIGYTTVLHELTRFAQQGDAEIRQQIERLTNTILNAILINAAALPAGARLRLACTAVCRYPAAVNVRALSVLLFKKPLKKLGIL